MVLSTYTPIKCDLINQDIDHLASATQYIRLSDCLQIPDHKAAPVTGTEHQDSILIF